MKSLTRQHLSATKLRTYDQYTARMQRAAPTTPTQQHCYSRLSLGRAQPTERVAVVTKQEKEFASSLRTSFLTSRVCARKCEYTCMGECDRPPICAGKKYLAVATVIQYTILRSTCYVGGRCSKLAFLLASFDGTQFAPRSFHCRRQYWLPTTRRLATLLSRSNVLHLAVFGCYTV